MLAITLLACLFLSVTLNGQDKQLNCMGYNLITIEFLLLQFSYSSVKLLQ